MEEHSAIANGVIAVLQGAAKELVAGNPAELTTYVVLVIDREAFDNIQKHLTRLKSESKVLLALVDIAQAATKTIAHDIPNLIALPAFEVARLVDRRLNYRSTFTNTRASPTHAGHRCGISVVVNARRGGTVSADCNDGACG